MTHLSFAQAAGVAVLLSAGALLVRGARGARRQLAGLAMLAGAAWLLAHAYLPGDIPDAAERITPAPGASVRLMLVVPVLAAAGFILHNPNRRS